MDFGIEITEDGTAVTGTTRQGRRARVALTMSGDSVRFDVSVDPLPGIPEDNERAVDLEVSRVTAEHDAILRRLEERFGDDLAGFTETELLAGAASAIGRTELSTSDIERMTANIGHAAFRAA